MEHVNARYTVKDGKVEEVKHVISRFVDAVRQNEPGTLSYEAFREGESRAFVHVMSFTGAAARHAHEASDHCREFVEVLYPLCEQPPEFTELRLVRSTRLPVDQ
jgi:quinol monooxygenase YgiN